MKIWHNEQDWPKDFGDYIFLARAVRIVGQAHFPNEWTDQDPAGELVELPEPRRNLVQPKSRHLMDPSRLPPPVPGMLNAYKRAREVAEAATKRAQASNAAHARVEEVKAVLIQWFSHNSVRTYTRKHSGGNFTPIHEFLWNGENIDFRFSACKININDPYEEIYSYNDKQSSWIFVNSTDIYGKLGINITKSTDDIFIPEILSFTLDFAKNHQKYIKNPRLDKDSLKTLVEENWPKEFGHVRSGTVEAIAKILRPIQAQLGTANPDRMAKPKS
jgi:hypothetical protein